MFVSNKCQNGWTDRAQMFWGIFRDPWEGLWMIKFSKICLHQNSIFENFKNPRIFFIKSPKFLVFVLLTMRTFMLFVNKENPHVYKWNKRWARSPYCFILLLYKEKMLTNRATIKSRNIRLAWNALKAYLIEIVYIKNDRSLNMAINKNVTAPG